MAPSINDPDWAPMQTIFERYGGFAQVSTIVSAFYDKVLESPILAPYFDGVDISRLMVHQSRFIAQAMGGPAFMTDHELKHAHARLQIGNAAFDAMVDLLRATLEEFQLDENDVKSVCLQIVARKPWIVA